MEILDMETVESLRELGAFEEVVLEFVAEVPQRLLEMRDALARGDGPSLKLEAHTLRGVGGVVGAAAVASRSASIEERAKSGRLDGVLELIDGLEKDFDEARTALEAEMAKTAAVSGEA